MTRFANASKGWSVLPIVLLVAACASSGGLIASFEDLSTESQKEGFVKVPQYRVMSVPGLLPFATVGNLYFYKARRKPASAVGISPACSYLVVSEVPAKCDLKCMAAIRDSLADLQSKGVKVIEARISLTSTRSAGDKAPQGQLASDEKAYQSAKTDFDASHGKITQSLTESGVVVYRWTTDDKTSGSLGLGKLFGGSYSSDRRYSGFALISGLRTTTLFIGPDIAERWPLLNKESRYKNRFELTTSIMQAKHIMYVAEADLESLLDATLTGSYAQLANLPEAVKQLDSIEVKATLAKLSSLGNMGVISGVSRKMIPVDWDQSDFKSQPTRDRESADGWHTFYSVQSDFTDLVDLATSENPHWKDECAREQARTATR